MHKVFSRFSYKNSLLQILPFFEKAVILKSPREGLDLFIEALAFLENDLIFSGGRYFGGEQPNVVDYGIFPYLDKVSITAFFSFEPEIGNTSSRRRWQYCKM